MAVSLRASRQGLEIVDHARKKKKWTKRAAAWYEAALVGEAALKKFWQRIPIVQENFVAICEAVGQKWEEIVDNSPLTKTNSRAEFFAYDDVWVGREQLVAELQEKVQGSCRLLILLGIAVIG